MRKKKFKFKVGTKVVYKKDNGSFSEPQYVISHKTMSKFDKGSWSLSTWNNQSHKLYKCNVIFLSDKRNPKNFMDVGWMPEDACFEYTKSMKVLYGKA